LTLPGPHNTTRSVDLRPLDWPVEDLEVMAQLLSGHQLDPFGVPVPLNEGHVRQAWEKVRSHPPFTSPPPSANR
jgi:hypothetical protein